MKECDHIIKVAGFSLSMSEHITVLVIGGACPTCGATLKAAEPSSGGEG